MTGEPGAKGAPRPSADERAEGQGVLGLGERERDAMLAWVGENLTVSGTQRARHDRCADRRRARRSWMRLYPLGGLVLRCTG